MTEEKIVKELTDLGIQVNSIYKQKRGWRLFINSHQFYITLEILKKNKYHIVLTTDSFGQTWQNPLWIWFFEHGE